MSTLPNPYTVFCQNDAFIIVQKAWETLSSEKTRADYDQQLQRLRSETVAMDTVHIDDIDFDEDTERYCLKCRCGEIIRFAEDDLNDLDSLLVVCTSCSLKIKVDAR